MGGITDRICPHSMRSFLSNALMSCSIEGPGVASGAMAVVVNIQSGGFREKLYNVRYVTICEEGGDSNGLLVAIGRLYRPMPPTLD